MVFESAVTLRRSGSARTVNDVIRIVDPGGDDVPSHYVCLVLHDWFMIMLIINCDFITVVLVWEFAPEVHAGKFAPKVHAGKSLCWKFVLESSHRKFAPEVCTRSLCRKFVPEVMPGLPGAPVL